MRQTPLFAQHLSRDAEMGVRGDWMLAERFGDLQAEIDAVRTAAGVLDLADRAVVAFRAPHVRRWAHAIFTNRVDGLRPGEGRRHAMTDDRGRVHGLVDLYVLAEDVLLGVVEGATADGVAARYRAQLLLEDVELDAFEDEPRWLLSLQGPRAAEVLARLGLPAPEPDLAHVPREDGGLGLAVLRRDRTGHGGFDLVAPASAVRELWEAALAAGAVPVGARAHDALRVLAGIPEWPRDGAGEPVLLHELGLEHAVAAFDKGCYIGQEVINRVEKRGSVQRRVRPLVLDGDAAPPDGAEVRLDGAPAGVVTTGARADGRGLALALLRRPAWPDGTRVEVLVSGRAEPATVREPPVRAA